MVGWDNFTWKKEKQELLSVKGKEIKWNGFVLHIYVLVVGD